MSTHLYTDAQIRCDAPGCSQDKFASQLDLRDATAKAARQVLRHRGWAVAVVERGLAGGTSGRRLDYCPAHKQEWAPQS